MIESLSIIIIVILDQLSKHYAVALLKPIETFPIITDVFHLTYATNTGAAFSLFSGHVEILGIISIIFSIFLIAYLIYQRKMKKTNLFTISLAFIIGGAIGNGIDRICLKYVIDFLDFRLINFAIFNLADSFVVIGVILIFLDILFDKKVTPSQ